MTAIKNKGSIAIYPLTDMQNALLYHHLVSEKDEGSLVTECRLRGKIVPQFFEEAWNTAMRRHEVLRKTVHWENLENPVIVLREDIKITLDFLDWNGLPENEQQQKLEQTRNQIWGEPVDFQKGPLGRLLLIKMNEEEHWMFWPTHHLLLDGWSGQIIISDVLKIYESLEKSKALNLPALPTYKTYLRVIRNTDNTEAIRFWKETFGNHGRRTLINPPGTDVLSTTANIDRKELRQEITESLQQKAIEFRITLSTFVQGLWALALGLEFSSNDLIYGTTVSGRSIDLDNIDLVAGMFMNMQPVRAIIKPDQPLNDWFVSLQMQRQTANQYDYQSLEQIYSAIEWPTGRPMFDSLFIFENYPGAQAKTEGIQISDVKSGLTSTYPLTFTVVPGSRMEWIIVSKMDDPHIGSRLLERILLLAEEITNRPIEFIEELGDFSNLTSDIFPGDLPDNRTYKQKKESDYVPARNKVELQLVTIIEKVLGKGPIGVKDGFLELGVNSFSASRIFNLINKAFNSKLLPTTILEFNTVEALAELLSKSDDQKISKWKNLVPISVKGSKNPLFCLHGGGGHVFYYKDLARSLAPERPVYALQPSGLFEGKVEDLSVEEMADSYLKEIREVSPNGPYNLLAYCFSTALGVEMSLKLNQSSEEVNLIILDSIVEQHSLKKGRFSVRLAGFLKRFTQNPFSAIRTYFVNRIEMFVTPTWQKLAGSAEEKQLVRVRNQLISAYKNYHWPSFNTPLKIILTEKESDLFNKELLNSWKAIYTGDMEIVDTEGQHRYLLEEPLVKTTAEKVDRICKD